MHRCTTDVKNRMRGGVLSQKRVGYCSALPLPPLVTSLGCCRQWSAVARPFRVRTPHAKHIPAWWRGIEAESITIVDTLKGC
jgi:hypothetical protein